MVSEFRFRGGLHLVYGPAKTGKTSLLRETIRQARERKHENWVGTPKPREWLGCADVVTPVAGILRHLDEMLNHRAETETDRLMRPAVLVIDDSEPEDLFTGRSSDTLSRSARLGRTEGVAVWIAVKRLPDELPRQLLDLAASVITVRLNATGFHRNCARYELG